MKQEESRFIVVKYDGERTKFLRHEGHNQFWSTQRYDAMEYTKVDVADALAKKHGGIPQAI